MSFHCIQYYVDQKGQEEGPILVVKNSHLNTFYLPISIFIYSKVWKDIHHRNRYNFFHKVGKIQQI